MKARECAKTKGVSRRLYKRLIWRRKLKEDFRYPESVGQGRHDWHAIDRQLMLAVTRAPAFLFSDKSLVARVCVIKKSESVGLSAPDWLDGDI